MLVLNFAATQVSDAEGLRENCFMQSFLADMGAIVTRHQSPAAKDVQGVGKIVDLRQI